MNYHIQSRRNARRHHMMALMLTLIVHALLLAFVINGGQLNGLTDMLPEGLQSWFNGTDKVVRP